MSIYNPGIPTGTVNLDQDYKNIQNNFSQANTSFGVDHVPFAVSENNGFHTNIHQVPLSAPPTPRAGINQLFTQVVDGDTQLFSLSAGGGLSQLTGNKNANRGWQFIGGVLLQWGLTTFTPTTTNSLIGVVFTASGGIAFPNAIYSIQLTQISQNNPATSSSNNSLFVVTGTQLKTGFVAQQNAGIGDFNKFYWVAIGS